MGGIKDELIELTDGVARELGVEDDSAWDSLEVWIMENVDPPDITAKVSPRLVADQWRKAHPQLLTVPVWGRRKVRGL